MTLLSDTVRDLLHVVGTVVAPDGGQRRSRHNALLGVQAAADRSRTWGELQGLASGLGASGLGASRLGAWPATRPPAPPQRASAESS